MGEWDKRMGEAAQANRDMEAAVKVFRLLPKEKQEHVFEKLLSWVAGPDLPLEELLLCLGMTKK